MQPSMATMEGVNGMARLFSKMTDRFAADGCCERCDGACLAEAAGRDARAQMAPLVLRGR